MNKPTEKPYSKTYKVKGLEIRYNFIEEQLECIYRENNDIHVADSQPLDLDSWLNDGKNNMNQFADDLKQDMDYLTGNLED